MDMNSSQQLQSNLSFSLINSESQFYPILLNLSTEIPPEEAESLFWEEVSPIQFPRWFQIAAHFFYNLILISGVVGNGCVLLIFMVKRPQFRKLPTPLLANLALADLLITIFCLETGYLSLIWQYWAFGKFLCYALSPIKPIAVFVSCYTLIALSIDRYLTVKDPLRGGVLSQQNIRWTVGIIWALAVGTSLPVGFFTAYEIHEQSGLPRCGEYVWESETKEIIYDSVLITLQFIAPVLVLIYTYSKITILVCKNRTLRERMSPGTSPRDSTFKTVKMSLIVIMGYIFAWLPYNVVLFLSKYNFNLAESDHFPYIFVGAHFLAMTHSVVNPIIYFWLNDSFRKIILELLFKRTMRNAERRRYSSTHFSWRNSTLTTSNGRSSITRPSTRLKSLQNTPTSDYTTSPFLNLQQKTLDLDPTECIEQEGVTLINEVNDCHHQKNYLG